VRPLCRYRGGGTAPARPDVAPRHSAGAVPRARRREHAGRARRDGLHLQPGRGTAPGLRRVPGPAGRGAARRDRPLQGVGGPCGLAGADAGRALLVRWFLVALGLCLAAALAMVAVVYVPAWFAPATTTVPAGTAASPDARRHIRATLFHVAEDGLSLE